MPTKGKRQRLLNICVLPGNYGPPAVISVMAEMQALADIIQSWLIPSNPVPDARDTYLFLPIYWECPPAPRGIMRGGKTNFSIKRQTSQGSSLHQLLSLSTHNCKNDSEHTYVMTITELTKFADLIICDHDDRPHRTLLGYHGTHGQ